VHEGISIPILLDLYVICLQSSWILDFSVLKLETFPVFLGKMLFNK